VTPSDFPSGRKVEEDKARRYSPGKYTLL